MSDNPYLYFCKNPICARMTTAVYCCTPCAHAHEGKYEIHETGLLAHSTGCNERHAKRSKQ